MTNSQLPKGYKLTEVGVIPGDGDRGVWLSEHARFQLDQRQIKMEWLNQTLSDPDRQIVGADSYGNTHYLKKIQEFGDRWLRVVINPNGSPQRVVTVFFDRRFK